MAARPPPDLIVAGSGAPGLLAALSAAVEGARVLVLERSPLLGGTSAISGGQIWAPLNDLMDQAGEPDDPGEALTYLTRVTLDQVPRTRLEQYLHRSPELLRCLQAWTALRFFRVPRPDYHPDFAGARDGRSLEPLPLETTALGKWRERIRRSPIRPPVTSREGRNGLDPKILSARRAADTRTQGAALVAGLTQGCLDRGVSFETGARMVDLITSADRVTGCVAEIGGTREDIPARDGVILATGGFEWNTALKDAFLPFPDRAPTSPPWNEGDGLVLGLRLGAGLAAMGEAWWTAAVQVPGETLDGHPMFRNIVRELALPGSILVNPLGRRFVNEASSYHDLGKAFQAFDPGAYGFPNATGWMVFDAAFQRRYPVVNVAAGQPIPAWFRAAPSIAALSDALGLPEGALAETIERFNGMAARGVDGDFGRGADRHGRTYGDATHRPNPCLGPIGEPPFHAIPILLGNNGTKGGLTTDGDGRVLRFDGSAIAGLYAVGNVAASPMGPGYPGTGASLGPSMTEALFAGRMAATTRHPEY